MAKKQPVAKNTTPCKEKEHNPLQRKTNTTLCKEKKIQPLA